MLKVLKLYFFCSFLLALSSRGSAQQLIINEVSQGTTGLKEYVELLVIGSPTCDPVSCMDLRGWYLDDNNGFHGSGSGYGIAAGCIRFSQSSLWQCVPIGTLILIYNEADINPSVPANDLSLTDGNCRLVLPVGDCNLFERHNSLPSSPSSPAFPTGGFISCGSWTNLSMANGGDSFQVVDPANLNASSFAVSWANNQLNTIIYFNTVMGGMTMYMTNAVDDNPFNQANWSSGPVPADETPGQPNSAANAAWVSQLNNNCQPRVPLTLTQTTNDASCGCTGSITVTPSGGIEPYSYSWTGTGDTDSTATGLCPGNYSIIVTGANGCADTISTTVGTSAQLNVAVSKTDVTCNGLNNGTATVTANTTATLGYIWDPPVSTAATASSLSPGTYTVTVSEPGGCDYQQSFIITEPQTLSLQTAAFDATCFASCNGQGVAVPSGGTTPYTFSWDQTGAITPAASNLCAGQHCVTVTDSRGCTADSCITISEPTDIVLNISSITATCNRADGSATVTSNGGTGAYTYSWDNGVQTNTVTDLISGTYCVKVTDERGCLDSVCVNVNNAPGVAFDPAVTTDPLCNDSCNGMISLFASSGTTPYTFSWEGISNSSSILNGACAGSFTAYVTDNIGCKDTINVQLTAPAEVIVTPVIPDTICIGQSTTLTASASGGTGSYSFFYSPSGPLVAPIATNNFYVTATDINGCFSDSELVKVNVHQPLNVNIDPPLPVCPGGTVNLNADVSGGDGNYSYQWLPGNNSTSSISIQPVSPGTYTVIVNDGCTTPRDTAYAEISITPSSAVVFSTDQDTGCVPFCVQLTDETAGSVTSTWTINNETYTGNVITFCPDQKGSYTVTLDVQAANGCTGTLTRTDLIYGFAKPDAAFSYSPESNTILDPEVTFKNETTGADNYAWKIEDSLFSSENLNYLFRDTGCFEVRLYAYTNEGCIDSTMQEVCIESDFGIYVPNAFSPNGDGINEVFSPLGFGISKEDYNMMIFNRWGELLYETTDPLKGWDGKDGSAYCPEEVYIWKLRVKSEKGDVYSYRGHVSIVK